MSSADNLIDLQAQAADLEKEIPLATNKDAALQLALDAAELCMKALRLATSSSVKSHMTRRCKTLLDEAERIKIMEKWQQPSLANAREENAEAGTDGKVKILEAPRSTRTLSKREQILLLQSSKLNGFAFPPWKGPPDPGDFALDEGGEKFLDSPDLNLSKMQLELFDGWKRPEDALPPPSLFSGPRHHLGPTMGVVRNVDLVQDAATDCSVVASLCAGTARAERGHAKLMGSIMFPYDHVNDRPRMSPNGKYIVRLNFNGCYRKVIIDDRLPVSKTSQILHVIDRRNPALLWPALLEKAYLKVRGGYDFPGSNSGTDLWIFTGWIPEQVFLQSDENVPDRLWARVQKAFVYGDVLITMGTGQMTHQAERLLGLAGRHDYAVLDMKEEDDQKWLLIKNPWCKGSTWRGGVHRPKSSPASSPDSWSGEDDTSTSFSAHSCSSSAGESFTPRTFWMEFGHIMQYFESMYLNWNPGLFSHRQDIHFAWDLSPDETDTPRRSPPGSFSRNPQYAVTVTEDSEVWLLLCRHFRTDEHKTHLESETSLTQEIALGFISLYAFDQRGQRVYLSDCAIERGPYVDSPQTLLKLKLPANVPYTVVASEQDLPLICHTFTFSAFSTSPLDICEAADQYTESSIINAAWTSSAAGGNSSATTYPQNPQFSLIVPHRTPASILLETTNENLNIHFKLVHGGGKRVYSLTRRDILLDSGDYRRGCALAETPELDAGTYTLICSTFEAGQLAPFTLRVDSMVQCQLRPIPKDGAGRIRTKLPDASFAPGQNRQVAPIAPHALSRFYISATSLPTGPPHRRVPAVRSPLRISISWGRGPDRKILMSSEGGEFSDGVNGVRTEDVDLSPDMMRQGELWLVVERLRGAGAGGGSEERVGVEMWGDRLQAVEVGVFRAWDE